MKSLVFTGVLFFALLMAQPIHSQSNGRKVIATHVVTDNQSLDVLRDVNTKLHRVFERNGFAMASIDNEDRVMTNLLNAVNFADAEVRSEKGEVIDFVFTIWMDRQGDDYKFYAKRQGRYNTDYKLSDPVIKQSVLIEYKPNEDIRELIALQIASQFINLSSQSNNLLKNLVKNETQILNGIRKAHDDSIASIASAMQHDRLLTWIAPSAVHFRNGHSTGGALLLTGEILSVGGGIFTFTKANSLVKTLKDDDWSRKRNDGTAMTDFERSIIESQYRTYQVVNYVCWGAAAVLYAVNVATSYKIISDKRYVIIPSVQQNRIGDIAYGVTLTYRF